MLLDMRPLFSMNYTIDGYEMNTEDFRNFSLRAMPAHFTVSANDADLKLVEFAPTTFLAVGMNFRAVKFSVSTIIFRRVVTKIFEAVVGFYAVVVARLHSFRTWGNEGFENKTMNISRNSFAIFPQANNQIAVRTFPRFQSSRFIRRFCTSTIITTPRQHRKDIPIFIGKISGEIRNWFHVFLLPRYSAMAWRTISAIESCLTFDSFFRVLSISFSMKKLMP